MKIGIGEDKIVYVDGDFAIIWRGAIFGSGFSCYRLDATKRRFMKINEDGLFFTSLKAAKKWLLENKMLEETKKPGQDNSGN